MEPSSVAIFDPHAFYLFRRLVQGVLHNSNELQDIERFVRAIVLHDEMSMILEPLPYDPLADEEMSTNEPGARNIIVGMGPVLSNYEGLLSIAKNLKPLSEEKFSSTLRDIAAEFSNAPPGNPYYKAHIEFDGKILAVSKDGGSIICEGRFSRALELRAVMMEDARAEIALNIFGFLISLSYATIIKTGCPPASPESRKAGRWRAGPWCSAPCDGARNRKKKDIH